MPTLEDNRRHWEGYAWGAGDGGNEWSQAWGGPHAQWYGTILPRIAGWLPAGRVLEIAPGFGRWTEFLVEHSDSLRGVDLAGTCVTACRARFARRRNVEFFQNDGSTMPMIGSSSVDLAFSFDSLVHVDREPVESYLTELTRVLVPGGIAYLHHSNLAAILAAGVAPEQTHWRSPEVSAQLLREWSAARGLEVIGQELVNWGCEHLIDAFTALRRPASGEAPRPSPEPAENYDLMTEANLARQRAGTWERSWPDRPPRRRSWFRLLG